MAITVARDSSIACPGCGKRRVVSPRHQRRGAGIRCASCRGVSTERSVPDEHLGFWLGRFGVRVPIGMSARSVILAGGTPDELRDLALTVFPRE